MPNGDSDYDPFDDDGSNPSDEFSAGEDADLGGFWKDPDDRSNDPIEEVVTNTELTKIDGTISALQRLQERQDVDEALSGIIEGVITAFNQHKGSGLEECQRMANIILDQYQEIMEREAEKPEYMNRPNPIHDLYDIIG